MPDRTALKVGGRIVLLRVPELDLRQGEREPREGREDAGWTADTIERIIAENPTLTITSVDEFGMPWFGYTLTGADGRPEYHSIALMEDNSWRLA